MIDQQDFNQVASALISEHDLPIVFAYNKQDNESFQNFIDIDKQLLNDPTTSGNIVNAQIFAYLKALSAEAQIKHSRAVITSINVVPHDLILRLHIKWFYSDDK